MFKDLNLKPVYTSEDDDIPEEFYNPVLRYAVQFDRTSAYFSAKALAMYSEGLEYMQSRGCKCRLIISHDISEEDYAEIKRGYAIKKQITDELLNSITREIIGSRRNVCF